LIVTKETTEETISWTRAGHFWPLRASR